MVTCTYKAFLANGTLCDASQSPLSVVMGHHDVIQGWEEGIALMSLGETAKIFIPALKGFGAEGNLQQGGFIPPNSDLIFEVELLKIGNKRSPKLKEARCGGFC